MGDKWRVEAAVQGSESYRVELSREGDKIQAECSCPYYVDHLEACKHIWATLLAAEAKGQLQGSGGRAPRQLLPVDPDGKDDNGDEEWAEPPRPHPTSRPRGGNADSNGPQAARPRQTAPAWKATLARLRSTMEKTPASGSATLPPGHEIIYVVDLTASLAGDGLVLEVATRSRKRDGEWSKPKGRRIGPAEIANLPEPADRKAMAILAGGREQASSYYGYYGSSSYDTAPARFRLTHTLSEALLPVLCPTGRCLARKAEPDGAMRTLRWDDAGPWEFWLKVTPAGPGSRTESPESCAAPTRGWRWRFPISC